MARLTQLPICVRLIKELHDKLMTGARGNDASRGEFRKKPEQDWQARLPTRNRFFCPPSPDAVEPQIFARHVLP